jgi:protein-S-isoprenylcysteine O-methyltransferase Ste14
MIANDRIKALWLGIFAGLLLVVLPLAGNPAMLRSPKPWILLVLGVLASLWQPSFAPISIVHSPGDRGTGAQIIWTVYGSQLAAVLEAGYGRYPQSVAWDAPAVVALIVAVLGLAVRTWAVRTLGRAFTMEIAVAPEQTVIDKGPFAIVRHPSYLGAFLLYLGTILFLHAWLTACWAIVALLLAFVRRIRAEEDVLSTALGQPYRAYRQKVTTRLLPGIW